MTVLTQVKSFRVKKDTLLGDFREELAAATGVPRQQQRLWFWEERHNGTLRPSKPVPPDADALAVQGVQPGPANKRPAQQAANELLLWLGTHLFPCVCMLTKHGCTPWMHARQQLDCLSVLHVQQTLCRFAA